MGRRGQRDGGRERDKCLASDPADSVSGQALARIASMLRGSLSDRAVIDRYVTPIIVRPNSIDIELREPTPALTPSPATEATVIAGAAPASACTTVISLPWSAPAFPSVKGVVHQPEAKPTLEGETRNAILLAVAKARAWIDGIASGRVQSFAQIAERERKVERHIRVLTPLAFIPPRTLAAIVDGIGPHDAKVTALAQAVPYRWDHSPGDQASAQTSDGGR
jgi:site-specific DNA recombinase